MHKKDLEELCHVRLQEARVLFNAKCFSGAYYLAGYSVELALKAVISKKFKSDTIPSKKEVENIHTHNLEELLKISGLGHPLRAKPELEKFWVVVAKWTENSRYAIWDEHAASALLEAVEHSNGILEWIKQHY